MVLSVEPDRLTVLLDQEGCQTLATEAVAAQGLREPVVDPE
ncbi:hypothetical protein [Blastococcus saxobsidens]|uniref:Uncharacterized protein n=1 Tax=Blastococcus saxobsidens (strain DD2) TaxID=1146883 RepID=H6RLM7_BLASD|nr:hypothetical protein [Blastococcus saxobsidens]CCG03753.1 Protein of unknown function [Blastococcus saxobsidens DD2]